MPLFAQHILKTMRRSYRLLALLLHMLVGLLLTLLLATIINLEYHNPTYEVVIRWWLSRITTIMGIKVRVAGKTQLSNVLYVANHVSWIDIPILGKAINPQFVAKTELKHVPAIGWIATHAGTLFLQRGGAGAAATMVGRLNERLQNGQSVLFFPEGTRGNGHKLRRFYPRLFSSAIAMDIHVQPVAVHYPKKWGEKPVVAIGDEQGPAQHLWLLLGEPSIEVEVILLPLISPTGMTRSQLASICERSIRDQLNRTESSAQQQR
jgi:1-acyl-sn-glycerol-3-phosphate acyltransferase